MRRHPARAVLACSLALLAACSTASTGGGGAPTPTLWTFEEFAWYRWMNKVSMNSTVGPIIVGASVLYGGSYSYSVMGQETRTSRLALLDTATGQARWRIDYAGAWGPMALHSGSVVAALGDRVIGFDLASGVQRWEVPVRARSLTVAGDVVLVAERETLRALDIVSGVERWQEASTTDPVAAGDAALFMDGAVLRSVAAGDGAGRWSLELPAALAYPQSLLGTHLYLFGAASLGSVDIDRRVLEWVVPLESAPTAGITAADGILYFTTRTPAGSSVFHAFDPATRKDRWSRPLDSGSRVAPAVMGPLVATVANSSAESLVALSRDTGTDAWSARAGSVPVQPVLASDALYVAGQGPNRVYAFDAATGAVRWSGRLWGWPTGMALTADGTLLVSADNLTLYAYKAK